MSERHSCFKNRVRAAAEGDDVLTERCGICGRVRMESDGVRPMAWYRDLKNETGFRYAYPDPRNNEYGREIFKHPARLSSENKE